MTCAVALAMLLDVSGSIMPAQWDLMRDGHAEALRSPSIARVAETDGLAIAVVQFDDTPRTALTWRVLRSRADAHAAAEAIAAMPRLGAGQTHTGTAVTYALRLLDRAPCGDDRVVDVATDGTPNGGRRIEDARDEAEAEGVRINVLFVGGPPAEAEAMREMAVTSTGFAMRAETWEDVPAAVRRKVVLEVGALRHAD